MSKHLLLIASDMLPISGDKAIELVCDVIRPPITSNTHLEKKYEEKIAKMNQTIDKLTQESVRKTLIMLIEHGQIRAHSKHFFTPITSGPINPQKVVLGERAFIEFCEAMTVKPQIHVIQKNATGSSKKTTPQQERDIRASYLRGVSQSALARTYGVSRPTIDKVIKKNTRISSPLDGLGQRRG
jgi:hypothetical protein